MSPLHLAARILAILTCLPATTLADGDVPDRTVQVCAGGVCMVTPRHWARGQGYVLVDLSDDWAPWLFRDHPGEDGQPRPNAYRARYVELANDRVNAREEPAPPGHHNHLALYGVLPSLSVLTDRWRAARADPCIETVNRDAIAALEGRVRIGWQPAGMWATRHTRAQRKIDRWMKQYKLDSIDALGAMKRYRGHVEAYQENRVFYDALVQTQQRLACEGVVSKRATPRRGYADQATKDAIERFERKYALRGFGHLEGGTRDALAAHPDVLHHRLLRVILRERLVDATGWIQDGTAPGTADRIGEATDALLRAAGLDDPATALDRLTEWKPFADQGLAVRLPPPPAGYDGSLAVSIRIDPGDVRYAFPYKNGKRLWFGGERPSLELVLARDGREEVLVRWPTTVGSWQPEALGDGYTYLKYKPSEVGQNLMRNIDAAPTWLPPDSDPAIARAARRLRPGRTIDLQFGQMGPGHRSAYGLAAGFLVKERCDTNGERCRDLDFGIRIHGSSAYMSTVASSSHGCHRIGNLEALRLYGYLLRHRPHSVIGQLDEEVQRELARPGDDGPVKGQLRLLSRRYRFVLDPPLGVTVSRGRVVGLPRTPIGDYMRIPGREYGEDAWVPPEGGPGTPPEE